MNNKNELKEEELGKVVGGSKGTGGNYGFDVYFTGFVSMYKLEKDHEYYFVSEIQKSDVGNIIGPIWFKAIVLNSWEQNKGAYTKCMHKVCVTVSVNGAHHAGETKDIKGDDYSAYTTKL